MSDVKITIDDRQCVVPAALSVRKAALKNGIYIPGLCSHPELDPFRAFNWSEEIWQGEQVCLMQPPPAPPYFVGGEETLPHCNLCLVEINGEVVRACDTEANDGLKVTTNTPAVLKARQEALKKILNHHPHACLTCAQKDGCSRTQCSMNVPVEERCCELLGRCEIGKVAEYIGIPPDTPAYRNLGRPSVIDEPLYVRDYELCVNCLRCVRICRDVREVNALGAVITGDNVRVGTLRGPTLVDALCRFCGACVEVCPTGALRDRPDSVPLVGDEPPCVDACPLGIDVPGYLELITRGLDYEALELIRQKAVLPGVLGYACFRPCEDNCRRCSLDEAASICALKRYVSDAAADEPPRIHKTAPTGKKIAVIGGGPAGLAAAADLLRWGHAVTIIDRHHKLGGMLRQSIPGFRLPSWVIDRDLHYLGALGLETRLGVTVGSDSEPDRLLEEGFDATIMAVGLGSAVSLGVDGENLTNVRLGLDFLRVVAAGERPELKGKVVVIGGGSVAVDAAMTARRLKADSVTMISLESPEELPASHQELAAAAEEGIQIKHRWGVSRIEGDGGIVNQVVLKKCTRVFDDQGKFSPEYDDTITETVPADHLVIAIGQKTDPEIAPYLKERPGLFIAGDAATGPTTIVAAMASGRNAAVRVQTFLGETLPEMPEFTTPTGKPSIGRDESFHSNPRVHAETLPPAKRIETMDVIEKTITRDQAIKEASRCLRCQLRSSIAQSPLPPDPWNRFSHDLLKVAPAAEGVVILADESRQTIKIEGSPDIRSTVDDLLNDEFTASFCRWELDPMYTKRESELLQAHLQAHGELPGTDELDDLF